MAADDVSLTELEVIAQFSLAVRAATAPRELVVAALEADLAALTGGTRPRATSPAAPARKAPAKTARKAAARKAPAKQAAVDDAPAEPASS